MSVEGPQAQVNSQEGDLYQQMLGKLGREHRLFSVHWELTYRCNQRCSHCYLDVLPPSAKPENELTTQECLGIVDQIAEAGALNLASPKDNCPTSSPAWFSLYSATMLGR